MLALGSKADVTTPVGFGRLLCNVADLHCQRLATFGRHLKTARAALDGTTAP
jgi:hypothetical protein